MSRVVQLLPRAAVQLHESASWWAQNRSVDQAARWLTKIEIAIAALATEAERHPLARESEAVSVVLHQMNFGVSGQPTHRVLYSFDENNVTVFAVRHLSQSDLTQRNI